MTVAIQNYNTSAQVQSPSKASKPTPEQLTERLIQLSLEAATIKRQLAGLALPDQDEDIALLYECFTDEVRANTQTEPRNLNQQFNLLFNNTF